MRVYCALQLQLLDNDHSYTKSYTFSIVSFAKIRDSAWITSLEV